MIPVINLNGFQKILLMMLFVAPESPKGGKKLSLNNEKLINAKDVLLKLNFITQNEEGLFSLTEKGLTALQEYGLIDTNFKQTPLGKIYASGKIPTQQEIKSLSQTSENVNITFKQYLKLYE